MIPISWTTIWRYRLVLPIIAAFLFLMFSFGAVAGAWSHKTEDLRLAASALDGAKSLPEQTRAELAQMGFEGYAQYPMRVVSDPLSALAGWSFEQGLWFGMANPEVGAMMGWVGPAVSFTVVIGYGYALYRALKRAGRWFW